MSIADEISRITANKNTIRNKLIELGLAESQSNLDVLAAAIGDIINHGAVQVSVKEGTTYTIPAGYHNGSGIVIALSDAEGDAEKFKLQAKSVVPTKSQQNITSDEGYYALSAVTIEAIPEAYQDVSAVTAVDETVLTGKIFVTADGVVHTGSMTNNGAVAVTLSGTTVTYTVPKGYHNGSGKVSIALETKTVTPTKSKQEIIPTSGKVLSKVTVNPIPDEYQDVTEVTAEAAHILEGKKIVDSEGNIVAGSMKNNGNFNAEIDGLSTTSYVVPAGYTGGGTVSLTSDIEEALAAI
ncbi:MAG: hypothetical protein IKJ27_00260 [Clostridia bacterium]|nr:hypothetical protein [Clostridia bacterium]